MEYQGHHSRQIIDAELACFLVFGCSLLSFWQCMQSEDHICRSAKHQDLKPYVLKNLIHCLEKFLIQNSRFSSFNNKPVVSLKE